MPTWKLRELMQKRAEKLAIEAHATFIIVNSYFNKNESDIRLFLLKEKAANRLYRRYQLAFGR